MIKNFREACVIALLSSQVACSAGSDQRIVMKVAHNGNEQHPFQNGFETIGQVIDDVDPGSVDFQIFPSSQIGSEDEAIEMVKLGVLASTAASAGTLGSFVPEADLFNFPFIFRDLDHFYAVLDGPIGDDIAKKIEERLNCIVLGWWFSGIRNTWNAKRPIHRPQDLQGLKIRVIGSPIVLNTFNAFGAQATNMSFGELYSAIQQGVLDGAECDHTDLLVEKFYEVTKYVSTTEHLFLAIALIFSKKQFDKLPGNLQTAVRRAGRESVQAQRRAMEKKNEQALALLKEKGLLFNDVDKAPFQKIASEVHQRNANKVGGMQIIEQVMSQ